MVAATVLIPTHDHAGTLPYAVASVQRQTMQDFELLIVGDGVSGDTREVVAGLAASEPRLRFFDNPKGARHGEDHRHAALAAARGRIVCYLADDDLWLPDHLAALAALLEDCDFGHTMLTDVTVEGQLLFGPWDLSEPSTRARALVDNFNRVSLCLAGHTREAYLRLPRGWFPAPLDLQSDLHMWRRFLAEPWCRVRSAMQVTTLRFGAKGRPGWTAAQRAEELRAWSVRAGEPGFATWLAATAVRMLASECVAYRLALEARTDDALYEKYQHLQSEHHRVSTEASALYAEYQRLRARFDEAVAAGGGAPGSARRTP